MTGTKNFDMLIQRINQDIYTNNYCNSYRYEYSSNLWWSSTKL